MTVKQNEPKEAQKTLEAFSWEAGRPNPRFRKMLKRQVLAAAKQPKLLFYFSTAMESLVKAKWGTLAIAGLAGLILLGAGGTGAYLYWQSQNNTAPSFISQEEALRRLYAMKNVYDEGNLSSQEIANSRSADYGDEGIPGEDLVEPEAPIGAVDDDYNNEFYHYRSVATYGPKSDSCPAYSAVAVEAIGTSQGEYVSDYYQYYSDGKNWNKSVEHVGDDVEIVRVSTDEYSLEYLGGAYALKIVYPEQVDAYYKETGMVITEESSTDEVPAEEGSLDEPVSSDDSTTGIEDMFGPDAQVEGPVEENGKYYYIVTYEADGSMCDFIPVELTLNEDGSVSEPSMIESNEAASSSGVERMIFKLWVDAETGMWGRSAIYINEVSENNLVQSVESSTEERKAQPWEVSGYFTFDKNVEIREIEMPVYDPVDRDETAEILSAEDPIVMFDTNTRGEFQLADIYVANYSYLLFAPTNYYADRAFFPAGETGDMLYDSYNYVYSGGENIANNLTSTAYVGGTCTWAGIDVYDGDPSVERGYVGGTNVTAYIDGVAVAAKLNKQEVVETQCDKGNGEFETVDTSGYDIVFEHGGYYYQVSLGGSGLSDSKVRGMLRFTTLDTSDSAQVSAVVEEIGQFEEWLRETYGATRED